MRACLRRDSLWLLTVLVALLWTHNSAADFEPTFEVSPQEIRIRSLYHGTDLILRGRVPEHSQVVVLLYGKGKGNTLNRKGRIGPLWMNVETVTIEGAPEVYYVLSSTASLTDLAPAERLLEPPIGYDALRRAVTIEQEGPDVDSTFWEFTKLKEAMGLYGVLPGAIALEPAGNGAATFSVSLSLPAGLAPGEYELFMYCFSQGRTVCSLWRTLAARRIGLTRQLSRLAANHGAVYGTVAIVVAIAAGLLMGLLFPSKAEGQH